MSEVISFRLNKDNPREAKALEVLKARSVEGYKIQHIITDALLKLDEHRKDPSTIVALDELNNTLSQVNQLLEQLENGHSVTSDKPPEGQPRSILTAAFVASIKKATKPGFKALLNWQ